MGKKYGIVVIGYNRPDSMRRILLQLQEADYRGDNVTLIISIDKSDTNDVYNVAEWFEWKYGEKIIEHSDIRLGLRDHVLKCGSYMEKYDLDAEAVFEDDIYPSTAFYDYMSQVVPYYWSDSRIAGISLYTHAWCSLASKPFTPAYNGRDVYFMQYAMSWGQIWTKDKWADFIAWYDDNKDIFECEDLSIPDNLYAWPKSSWLKYHIAYCIKTNKYFVFPYESLATCFAEVGQHVKKTTSIYQSRMNNVVKKYSFLELDECPVIYDAWFERTVDDKNVCFDIYGTKNLDYVRNHFKYILTERKLDYRIMDSFALSLKPHEENYLQSIKGDEVFLYNLQEPEKNRNRIDTSDVMLEYYNYLIRSKMWFIKYGLFGGVKKLIRYIMGEYR